MEQSKNKNNIDEGVLAINVSMKTKWHEKQHHQQQKYKQGSDLQIPLLSVALCILLCTHVVMAMFLSKKSNNSESQAQNTVWFSLHTCRVYKALSIAFYFFLLFFSTQKKFCKKGVIGVISMLHNMKVRCHLLRQKNKHDVLLRKIFFFLQEVMLHFLFDSSH